MSFVIIGNSTAAIGAVEGIRKYDRQTGVCIISDEPYNTYSRPLISYFLGGKVLEKNIYYRDEGFYERNNVKPVLGVKAQSIDFNQKCVILQNADRVPYSKLLIATGGKPFVPPIEGVEKENVFNFIKLDDVKKIEKAATVGSKAIAIGASFSGLKAVEALVQRGVNVTVIDIMSRIMPRVLDDTAAAIAEKTLEDKGVKVLLGTTVEKIFGDDKAKGVILKDGSELYCDFVILAIGVRCNTDIVQNTELKVNRGIVVDDKMQTNIPDVYAAGDVAEGYNFIEDKHMEIAIIPNAYRQGETAGANMAGESKTFDRGFIMNSMPLFDLSIMSAGVSSQTEAINVKTIYDPNKKSYKKFYIKNNTLAGYLVINDIEKAGIYTDFIRNQTDISGFQDEMGAEGFGFVSLPETLRKSRMLRREVI